MLNLIKEIIATVGPRPAGTPAETNAQHLLISKYKQYTNDTEFLPFDEYLDARFGKLKYYVIFFFISLGLYWVLPAAGAALAFINGLVLLLDMGMYRDILTNVPGKKGTSSNATATLAPKGPVKTTILLGAHIDSTPEFTWWYKYGQAGVVLTVVAMLLIVLLGIFLVVHVLHPTSADLYIWAAFALLSPSTIVVWTMLGTEVVQGAQDNLSGIAIGFEVFKTLSDKNEMGKSVLQNTRLRLVSFGSEEKGLLGSRAYAKLKKDSLKQENAYLINIDNVRVADELAIITKEILSGVNHSPVLIKALQESFTDLNIPYKMGVVPIGGSDAMSLSKAGIPSITLIGMDTKKHDYTYHTRHDIPDNIEPLALEHLRDVVLNLVRKWDAK